MKTIILSIAALFLISNEANSQGLKLEPQKFKTFEKWTPSESMGFSSSTLPSKISFREYCPLPNHQGNVSNCVGWAVAYSALSTQYNIDMGVTSYMQKWARAFDPNFIYNFVKHDRDKWCEVGSSLSDAMDVLKKYGCKPMIWAPWLNCNDPVAFDKLPLAIASNYRIAEWYAANIDNLTKNVKEALVAKFPVVVGVKLTESFMKGASVKYGHWSPEQSEGLIGGHAMCVIGYDDNKFGGAFEVMNSYGEKFGDNGFVWISYKDFEAKVDEAYIMLTQPLGKKACSFGNCYDNYSRYKFDGGNIYEGTFTNNYLDGYGSMLYSNGSFYVGGWNMGRKNGYGLLWDHKSKQFYNTYYKNDELVEYSEKSFGFAQSEADKKAKSYLDELTKNMLGSEKAITDFEQTKKALIDFEAPDKPIKVEKGE